MLLKFKLFKDELSTISYPPVVDFPISLDLSATGITKPNPIFCEI